MNRINKKGQLGDMVEMIPRVIMLSIIAVSVFGIASAFYSYDVSVRGVEARLLGRAVVDCLSGDGVINLDEIGEEERKNILSYCGISEEERLYVGVEVMDSSGKKIGELYEGDSGLLWVKDLFELTGNVVNGFASKEVKSVKKIERYMPGYYKFEYPVFVVENGNEAEGRVKVEVLVSHENE